MAQQSVFSQPVTSFSQGASFSHRPRAEVNGVDSVAQCVVEIRMCWNSFTWIYPTRSIERLLLLDHIEQEQVRYCAMLLLVLLFWQGWGKLADIRYHAFAESSMLPFFGSGLPSMQHQFIPIQGLGPLFSERMLLLRCLVC